MIGNYNYGTGRRKSAVARIPESWQWQDRC
jgi:ribosomal protein S9